MAHLYLMKLLQTFLNFELLSLMSLSGPLIFALNLSSLTSAVLILKLTDSPSVLEEVAAYRFSNLRLLSLVSLVGSLIFALNSSSLRSTQSGANDEGERKDPEGNLTIYLSGSIIHAPDLQDARQIAWL